MASESVALANRLSRFNKKDLIGMLVNRKLPVSISDCGNLNYITANNCEKLPKSTQNDDQKPIDAK